MLNRRQRTQRHHLEQKMQEREAKKYASQNKKIDKLIEELKRQKEANERDLEVGKRAIARDLKDLLAENESLKQALAAAKTCKYCNDADATVLHTHKDCLLTVSTIESTL